MLWTKITWPHDTLPRRGDQLRTQHGLYRVVRVSTMRKPCPVGSTRLQLALMREDDLPGDSRARVEGAAGKRGGVKVHQVELGAGIRKEVG